MAQTSRLLPPANFTRRLMAAVYDLFLLLAILFLAAAAAVFVVHQLNPNLTGDQASEILRTSPWFRLYLVICAMCFYSFFWHRSGQTLGMKVWKIKVQSINGQSPSWLQCFIRFITAAFGLNLLSILFSPTDTAFNDYFSKTEVVRLN